MGMRARGTARGRKAVPEVGPIASRVIAAVGNRALQDAQTLQPPQLNVHAMHIVARDFCQLISYDFLREHSSKRTGRNVVMGLLVLYIV